MTAELGHFALILAFAISIPQIVIPMFGAHRGWNILTEGVTARMNEVK